MRYDLKVIEASELEQIYACSRGLATQLRTIQIRGGETQFTLISQLDKLAKAIEKELDKRGHEWITK